MPTVIVSHPENLPTLTAPVSPTARSYDPKADGGAELDRQVQTYVDLGFPELLGLDEPAFRAALLPLRGLVADLRLDAHDSAVPEDDHVPFVVVLDHAARRPNDAVPAMRRGTKHGVSVIDDEEIETYRPVDGVDLPDGVAYLLGGIDVGSRYVNVTPETALASVVEAGRSPLTIAEGLAVVILRPDMLRPNRCFSLAASRTGTNQRVPAIWISERRPKLGWCWDRNPHTWLGTASAGYRRAMPAV
ncbi:DUF5701 family protein [Georgenia subflava]|uniref:Uncharacterized protein n=1 Tax=Georgenia subflava TaxID=1622177 RepID=A0A6N7EJY1_9MICO|nr:DUF5701 family protein [Georgenia subflava]MPV38459.1 hypothetical protein [Georgenia subflava]